MKTGDTYRVSLWNHGCDTAVAIYPGCILVKIDADGKTTITRRDGRITETNLSVSYETE